MLNARFSMTPSLRNALLLHQFDDTEAAGHPWLPCPQTCWGAPCWCANLGDRVSTTLLHSSLPGMMHGKDQVLPLFSIDAGGMLVSGTRARVLCAYSRDGGSTRKLCHDDTVKGWKGLSATGKDGGKGVCLPGCIPDVLYDDHGHPTAPNWCGEEQDKRWRPNDSAHSNGNADPHAAGICPWRATQLDLMVGEAAAERSDGNGAYNEVVIDAESVVESLPWSVEAFVFLSGTDGAKRAEEEEKVRKAHAAFLRAYRVTAADVPLLRVDLTDFNSPFSNPDEDEASYEG